MPARTLLICLLLPWLCAGQDHAGLSDSSRARLRRDSLHIYRKTLAKPFLKIENRNSFIISEPVDFYGGMLGATFWNRHTIAAGYYFLDARSKEPLTDEATSTTQQFLRFSYFNFAYQLVLINRRFVQLNVPFEIGAGSYYARTTTEGTPGSTHHSGIVVPYSGGAQLIGKITRWIGVSATGGYRYVQNNARLVKFNGLYYSYGVWLDARQVIRDYRYRRARRHYRLQEQAANAK